MRHPHSSCATPHRARAFSLAELLVVLGIIALLIAIIVPPLQRAHRQARRTKCCAQLQQLGRALESAHNEYGFYPLWDDGGTSVRYTWIDILVQLHFVAPAESLPDRPGSPRSAAHIGYCPSDAMPDPMNAARHGDLLYPPSPTQRGIDYSYGIGAPLSAGGWAWHNGTPTQDDAIPRRFQNPDTDTAGRVLAGDANSSTIFNLSGYALQSGIWNDRTQFDNTVAWQRHRRPAGSAAAANILFQDGHVSAPLFDPTADPPVNTAQTFVWYPGEPVALGPSSQYDGNAYPFTPPPSFEGKPAGDVFPRELTPLWYTRTHGWTRIEHK